MPLQFEGKASDSIFPAKVVSKVLENLDLKFSVTYAWRICPLSNPHV